MPTLTEIDARAKRYAQARERVIAIITDLNKAMELLKNSELPKLRRAIASAAEHHDALKAMIAEAPELFAKPKTITAHGIRYGFAKGKGKIEWADADRVVALIKKHYPEQADTLIATEETPVKAALNNLPASALRKLEINVIDAGEAVFIKPVDSAVDKLVAALLKEATKEDAATAG